MSTEIEPRGSIPNAMAWMIGLSAGLFWWPVLGPLIAGFVGGRKAGTPGRAITAAILPGVLGFFIMLFVGGFLQLIPIIGPIFGMIAGLSGKVLGTMHLIPLLIGAVIGGFTADR